MSPGCQLGTHTAPLHSSAAVSFFLQRQSRGFQVDFGLKAAICGVLRCLCFFVSRVSSSSLVFVFVEVEVGFGFVCPCLLVVIVVCSLVAACCLMILMVMVLVLVYVHAKSRLLCIVASGLCCVGVALLVSCFLRLRSYLVYVTCNRSPARSGMPISGHI